MRRRGFTMLEVTAAMAVVTALLLLGVHLGKRYVQMQREQIFLDRLETEWSALQSRARLKTGRGQLIFYGQGAGNVRLDLYVQGKRWNEGTSSIPFPSTLRLFADDNVKQVIVEQSMGGMFADPATVKLVSSLGYEYKVTFEMGWGRLDIKKQVAAGG